MNIEKMKNENPRSEGESQRKYAQRLASTYNYSKNSIRAALRKEKNTISKKNNNIVKELHSLKERAQHLKILKLSKALRETQDKTIIANRRLSFYESFSRPSAKLDNVNVDDDNDLLNVIVCSDWHLEHVVKSHETQNINEYNSSIAKKRLSIFIKKLKKSLVEGGKYIIFNGDMIDGYLRDSSLESNEMSPIQASIEAYNMMQLVIDEIADDDTVIRCNYGNHGRTNRQKQIAGAYKNSYEYMIYNMIAINNKNLDVRVSRGPVAVDQIGDFRIRSMHGDNIASNKISSVFTKISKLETQQKADYNIISHFHDLCHPRCDTTINGSLIGYDQYAEFCAFKPNLPQQSHLVIDLKNKVVKTRNDILCI